jgi:hypothetical protein
MLQLRPVLTSCTVPLYCGYYRHTAMLRQAVPGTDILYCTSVLWSVQAYCYIAASCAQYCHTVLYLCTGILLCCSKLCHHPVDPERKLLQETRDLIHNTLQDAANYVGVQDIQQYRDNLGRRGNMSSS